MKILNTELAVYCEKKSIAVITILNKHNKKMHVHVQTINRKYHKDLLIHDGNNKCLNKDDFNDYENDIKKIINCAEGPIDLTYDIKYIKGNVDYVLKVFKDKVTVSEAYREYANRYSKQFKTIYTDVKDFATIEEAERFVKSMY